MSEHLMPAQVERYRAGKLSAAELQTIDEHIGRCEACRDLLTQQLGNLEDSQAALLAEWPDMLAGVGAETEHLSYEQAAAYVERGSDTEAFQEIERHLNQCAECNERVQNLIAFREEAEASEIPERPQVRPSTFWHRLLSFRLPRLTLPQLVPAAAAAVLIIGLGVWFLSTSTQAPLALNDGGGRVILDERGRIITPRDVPSAYQEMMKGALGTRRVKRPSELASLLGVAGRLRSASSEDIPFELIAPLGTVIENQRPTLRWQPLRGATSYSVTVTDRENVVATSPPLSGSEWTLPEPLSRGVIYTWQVTALKDGERVTSPPPPAPEARFKILEQDKTQELELARKKYPGMHLLLGNLYAEAGLLDEAEKEFQLLLAANPQSPVAAGLLESVRLARDAK